MKLAGLMFAAALACAAQVASPPPFQTLAPVQTPAPAAASAAPQFDRVAVGTLEMSFEKRIEPFQLMGTCAGVYVNGYGMVFTIPIALAVTPTANPFRGAVTKQEASDVHKLKLERLPVLRKTLKEMLASAFNGLPKLPAGDKIALGIRVFYLEWEDKSGLPSLIVVSADRASALAGNFQTDEQ